MNSTIAGASLDFALPNQADGERLEELQKIMLDERGDNHEALLTASDWIEELNQYPGSVVSYRDTNGEIIAFGSLNNPQDPSWEGSRGEFTILVTDPEWRHKGLGQALVTETMKKANEWPGWQDIQTWVRKQDEHVIKLFANAGFTDSGEDWHGDELVLVRDLPL